MKKNIMAVGARLNPLNRVSWLKMRKKMRKLKIFKEISLNPLNRVSWLKIWQILKDTQDITTSSQSP